MAEKFTKLDVVRSYLVEFPKAAKIAIARILLRDHPMLFNSVEHARSAVNQASGTNGDRQRKNGGRKDLFRPGMDEGEMPKLPQGLKHFEEWRSFVIPGAARILDLPDVHIPYHDHDALKLAIQHGIDFHPTHVLLSGDFVDFFSVSFWQKDPSKRDLKGELDCAYQTMSYLRKVFKDAKIILKVGNHEERWERFLTLKAPELFGVPEFQLTNVLHLKEYDIEMVSDMRPIKAGQLFIVHGHEFRWGITNPVNPARGFYLRAKENCIGHHLHQTSSHSEKSLAGDVVSCWSTGCLCDLHPDYSPINKWNHGFATITTDDGGMFEVHNYKIIEGRIFEG